MQPVSPIRHNHFGPNEIASVKGVEKSRMNSENWLKTTID